MTLITTIVFLAVLAVLVILHELGHFLVARHFHVRVEEFGLGFPPRLCKLFRWRGTDFVLNLIPLGGYVNLAGEVAPDGESPTTTPSTDQQEDDEFFLKPAWQRFLVILAGPGTNFLIAVLVFIAAYGVLGIPKRVPDMVFIDYLVSDSPAVVAKIPVGARIVTVQDATSSPIAIKSIDQVLNFVHAHYGQIINLELDNTCQSGVCLGQTATYTATLRPSEEATRDGIALGVALTDWQDFHYPWYQQLPYSVYYGIKESLNMSWEMILSFGTALRQIVVPGPKQAVLMGPVGIVNTLTKVELFAQGFWEIFTFFGFLSLNLAVINLLPIPAVDGGRLVLIISEKIFGRARVAKIEGALNLLGFAILIILALAVTGSDIWRIVTGG